MMKRNNKKLKYRPSAILMSCLLVMAFSSVSLIASVEATSCPGNGHNNCHVRAVFGGNNFYKAMKGTWTVKDPVVGAGVVAHTSWMVQPNFDMYENGWSKYPGELPKYYWAKLIGGIFSGRQIIATATVGAVKTFQIDDLNGDKKWTMTVSGFPAQTDTVAVTYSTGKPQAGGESTHYDLNSMPKNEFTYMYYYGGTPQQWRLWDSQPGWLVEDSYWLSFCAFYDYTIGKDPPAGCP